MTRRQKRWLTPSRNLTNRRHGGEGYTIHELGDDELMRRTAGIIAEGKIVGWYQGRATHIHIEVTMGGRSVKVTQIAFPESINNTVYGTGVYASRGSNPMSIRV